MNTIQMVLLLIIMNMTLAFVSVAINPETQNQLSTIMTNEANAVKDDTKNQMDRVSSGDQADFVKNPETSQMSWFETMIQLGEYAGMVVGLIIFSIISLPNIGLEETNNIFAGIISAIFMLAIIMINAMAILRIWDKFVNRRQD